MSSNITKIQVRQGTNSTRKTTPGVVLDVGEPGFTVDSKRFYIGDGATTGGLPVGIKNWGTYNPVFSTPSLSGYSPTVLTILSAIESGDIIYDGNTYTLYYATAASPLSSQWVAFTLASTITGYNGVIATTRSSVLSVGLSPGFTVNDGGQTLQINYATSIATGKSFTVNSANLAVNTGGNLIVNGGNISTTTGIISTVGGNSNQWNTATSTVTANSANWSNSYSTVAANSANWTNPVNFLTVPTVIAVCSAGSGIIINALSGYNLSTAYNVTSQTTLTGAVWNAFTKASVPSNATALIIQGVHSSVQGGHFGYLFISQNSTSQKRLLDFGCPSGSGGDSGTSTGTFPISGDGNIWWWRLGDTSSTTFGNGYAVALLGYVL